MMDKNVEENGCPKCGFAHYGAKAVYGNKAYRYKLNQQPWFRKKLIEYTIQLLKEIESSRIS